MAKSSAKAAAQADAAPASRTVRVLVDHAEGEHKLKPNQLVILASGRAEVLEAEGRVSADLAGIEWCVGEYPDAPILDLFGASEPAESEEPPGE